jgi:hypothetical protein
MTADQRFLEYCVKRARDELGESDIRVGQRDFDRGAYLIIGPDDSELLWIDENLVREGEQEEIVKRIVESWPER